MAPPRPAPGDRGHGTPSWYPDLGWTFHRVACPNRRESGVIGVVRGVTVPGPQSCNGRDVRFLHPAANPDSR
jgi:hypothetical protein